MNGSETITRLEVRRVVNATPEEVFAAWTRPEALRQWMAPGPMRVPEAEAESRPGGAYRIRMEGPDGSGSVVRGTYIEVVANQRLVFTWQWEGADWGETLVTVELRPVANGTEVAVVHERFGSAEEREQHLEGWHGCLEKLVAYLGP